MLDGIGYFNDKCPKSRNRLTGHFFKYIPVNIPPASYPSATHA